MKLTSFYLLSPFVLALTMSSTLKAAPKKKAKGRSAKSEISAEKQRKKTKEEVAKKSQAIKAKGETLKQEIVEVKPEALKSIRQTRSTAEVLLAELSPSNRKAMVSIINLMTLKSTTQAEKTFIKNYIQFCIAAKGQISKFHLQATEVANRHLNKKNELNDATILEGLSKTFEVATGLLKEINPSTNKRFTAEEAFFESLKKWNITAEEYNKVCKGA